MSSFKHHFEFGLFKSLQFFISFLPRKICLCFGKIMGLFFFYTDKKHRFLAFSNLKTALGTELPLYQRKRVARKSFIHFGRMIMEVIKFPHLPPLQKKNLVETHGISYLKQALAQGKGALLFTAHYGNWEIAPYFVTHLAKLKVIARHLDNPFLENELLRIRSSLQSHIIYKHKAAKKVLRSLQANQMVAILIDQNVLPDQAVFVDFFGKKAATTPSLAYFQLKTQAPLIPVFCYPISPDKYILNIHPPLNPSLSGDSQKDTLKITQLCTKMIESQIREHAEYWLWFHNRWKSRSSDK
ncbi:lysophospholipid acyltransferase family protein [bacterium]|nr:lysophospholipid acyltransferase family protein [bacterium]